MCFHQKRSCECGHHEATIFHRDSILPEEILVSVFCPDCRSQARFDPETMMEDAGWILEYDMAAARFYFADKGVAREITPEWLFDNDYCSWYGLTPTDMEENARLHARLDSLKRTDVPKFMRKLTAERIARVAKLKEEGWRKAQSA